ncbi:MAG: hypothetical protein M1823_004250 [Watsoniomyces obsoletus]|nr:MAG: hypothetical protein M1823_004250 [Watsoniomyces obsoletus]
MNFLFLLIGATVLAKPPNSPACLLQPKPTFGAGGVIQFSLAAGNRSCEATLTFENDDFLPLHYALEPITCRGDRVVKMPIPFSAPNGEAYLSWICTGDSTNSCVRTEIVSIAENRTQFLVDREDPGEVVTCKDFEASSNGAVRTSMAVSRVASAVVGDSSACGEAEQSRDPTRTTQWPRHTPVKGTSAASASSVR